MEIDELFKMRTNVFDDEYINEQDGLIYCRECNTPREGIIEKNKRIYQVPIMCKCQEVKMARKQRQKYIFEQNTRNKADMQAIGITQKLLTVTLENDDKAKPTTSQFVREYITGFERNKTLNIGVLFMGNIGVGKTFYSRIIVSELYKRGYLVLPIKIVELMKIYQNFKNTHIIDKLEKMLQTYDLVFIDDLGVERQTEFAFEKLFNVFDIRCDAKKPLIVTTNLTNEDINNASTQGARIYDRVNSMCKRRILIKGKSRRIRKGEEGMQCKIL